MAVPSSLREKWNPTISDKIRRKQNFLVQDIGVELYKIYRSETALHYSNTEKWNPAIFGWNSTEGELCIPTSRFRVI